jgi:hypothetical protein
VSGGFDDLPEQAFDMKGGIEDVIEAAEKMKAQGEVLRARRALDLAVSSPGAT